MSSSQPSVSKADLYSAAVYADEDGMSIRKVAKQYNLMRESLRCRVRGYVSINCRRGPQFVYISDGADKGLLEAIFYRSAHGLSIGTSLFRDLVRQAALTTSITDVPDNFLNIKWIQRRVKRHSKMLSYRKGRILDVKRAECSTEETVRYYFTNLENALSELGLSDKPAQIWNCNKTGVTAQGNCKERVICSQRNVTERATLVRPRKLSWMEKAPTNAKCQVSESSNINTGIFLQWFKWFVELLPPARPQLLILDGPFAHISLATVKYGLDNNVHIFVLPAHTSHFLQPLDVGVYQAFKALYDKGVKQYPLRHSGALLVKDDVGEISKAPFEKSFSEKNIARGFRDTGIFPMSLETMLYKMVGNKPAPNARTLRYHSLMVPQFDGQPVDVRTQAALKRRKLDLDTLNVVNLSLKMILTPQPQKRPTGYFIDEKVSGVKLLSYAEMLRDKHAKDDKKRAKEDAKQAIKHARKAASALKAAAKLSKPLEAKARAKMALHDKSMPRPPRKRSRQLIPGLPRTANLPGGPVEVIETWVF